jgi:hypothetical protein
MTKFLIGVGILCVTIVVFYIFKRCKERKQNEELAKKFWE